MKNPFVLMLFAALLALGLASISCTSDDDDDDDDDAATDDDAGDDDTMADDDVDDDIDDDGDDDIDDDSATDDDADDDTAADDDIDDDADDDDDDHVPISPYVMALKDAQINVLSGDITYSSSYFSIAGEIHVDEIGTTMGAAFSGDLANVEFRAAEIDWDTGQVQIDMEGDSGFILSDPVDGNITVVPQRLAMFPDPFGGFDSGKAEIFNFDPFVPCVSATCNMVAYASVSKIFQVQQFTDGALNLNDYIVIWAFDGYTEAGAVLDLTMEVPE